MPMMMTRRAPSPRRVCLVVAASSVSRSRRPAASPLFFSSSSASSSAQISSSRALLLDGEYVVAVAAAATTAKAKRTWPPRARYPLFLLLLTLSPDSALTARAHICMRVPVSLSPPSSSLFLFLFSLLPSLYLYLAPSPPFFAISLSLSFFRPALSACAHNKRVNFVSLSLSPSLCPFHDARCTNIYVCIHREMERRSSANNARDGKRARARAARSEPVFEFARARVCAMYSISATRRA